MLLPPLFSPSSLLAWRNDPKVPIFAIDSLTVRQREIFDLAVHGFTNAQIAVKLKLSVKTVETHRAKIRRKLNIHSTAELVRFAVLHGLYHPERFDNA